MARGPDHRPASFDNTLAPSLVPETVGRTARPRLHRETSKSAQASTSAGKRGRRRPGILPTLALAAALSACGTYSDGSMAGHGESPHSHTPGEAHHGPDQDEPHHATGGVAQTGGHRGEPVGDGRSASLRGYSLEAAELTTGQEEALLSFRIRSPSGAPQLQYALDRGKLLHLYVMSEDLSSFHHVHPMLDSSGYWRARLPSLAPGRHRVAASFAAVDDQRARHALLLGTDVLVPGQPHRSTLPPPRPTAAVDGLVVQLTGTAAHRDPSALTLSVTRDGRPVQVEPYLESWAHVTAVHEATRALVHAHSPGNAVDGSSPPRRLRLTMPPSDAGRYRIFVEFMTHGRVHQVAFTRDVAG